MELEVPKPPHLWHARPPKLQHKCRVATLAVYRRLVYERKFQSCFQFICCKDLTSGELKASSCNRTGS